MELVLAHFKQIIIILKTTDREKIIKSLESLRTHWDLLKDDLERDMERVKKMVVRNRILTNQLNAYQNILKEQYITPWVPVLRGQQEAAIYKDVARETLTKISSNKKEIDILTLQKNELNLKLKVVAKKYRQTQKAVERASVQMFILETALEVLAYFNSAGVSAGAIPEYEVKKYFDQFRRDE